MNRENHLRKRKKLTNEKVRSVYKGQMKPAIFDYICNISSNHHYVFINNPKVASTSILRLLQQNECLETANLMKCPHTRHESPLLKLSDLDFDDQVQYLYSDNVFKFSFVRNPFTRILSAYKSKIDRLSRRFKFNPERPFNYPPKGQIIRALCGVAIDEQSDFNMKISFHEFLEVVCSQNEYEMDCHWKTQHKVLCVDHLDYNFIGRFETLNQDINLVSDKLGFSSDYAFGVSNETGSSALLDQYFTPDLVKMVVDKYQRDFEIFGYSEALQPLKLAV